MERAVVSFIRMLGHANLFHSLSSSGFKTTMSENFCYSLILSIIHTKCTGIRDLIGTEKGKSYTKTVIGVCVCPVTGTVYRYITELTYYGVNHVIAIKSESWIVWHAGGEDRGN